MKIKIKVTDDRCFPENLRKGDWFDLKAATDMATTLTPQVQYLSLGVAMQLPKGFEAYVVPRSSTPNRYGLIMANSVGIIDNSFRGNGDIWKFPFISFRKSFIPKYNSICQFRIQLSQKATLWQRIKWLFSRKIELVKVDSLNNENRGGFGSTGY